jgi:arylsulfate sulfotransferase
MIQQYMARQFVMASLIAAILTISPWSRAITILSGPSFTPATNAPLAGLLQLTTDVDSRVSVLVSDGTDIWERDFYDYATTHSVPLLGFKPNQTNQILVTVYDKDRNAYTAAQPLTFVTAPLPTNFPPWTVLTSEPSVMEPGYTLFIIFSGSADYITIMDNSGEVVWYSPSPWSGSSDVRQLDNGDLFMEEDLPANCFQEINMLGQIVQTWHPPAGYTVNPHEGLVTDHGTIMYLSDVSEVVSNFPSSLTISNAPLMTVNVDDNPVVEISFTNSALLNVWSPLDVLDPTRVTYLTFEFGQVDGVDNEHANAIIEDTNDNSIIVSLRDQNAVYKFARSTGQLKWILGPHALWGTNWQPYLLTPVGTPFDWNYGQHAPELTPQGTLLLYNDGNERASPYDPPVADQDNYSSAVEYNINETNMTVSEVWNSAWQTNQDRLFTLVVGKAQWLPQTRDVLVTYGYVTYVNGVPPSTNAPNATMVRIIEYTHDPVPQVVFDLSFFDNSNTSTNYGGDFCYRAYQIPDLYPHPAEPVTDLVAHDENRIPLLEFSADPTHSYLIQASTDLKNWTTIGTPVQEGGVGDYDFEDLYANQFTNRFYRVVTQ